MIAAQTSKIKKRWKRRSNKNSSTKTRISFKLTIEFALIFSSLDSCKILRLVKSTLTKKDAEHKRDSFRKLFYGPNLFCWFTVDLYPLLW